MQPFLLLLHLLSATIWVGGHLVLCLRILPKALRSKEPRLITAFETDYEPLGLSALLVLVITGIAMAYGYGVPIAQWFHFETHAQRVISIKLILLLTTLATAAHGRLVVIPKLSAQTLPKMALHIVAITMLGIALLVTGVSMRFAWW